MPTDPLTGSRYPASSAAPNVAQDIQNAVFDLADNTIPRFATATARNTAYTSWVAAGGAMAAGLHCTVAGRLNRYDGSAWQDEGIGIATSGRQAITVTAKSATTTLLTPLITIPAIAVDARFLFTAMGRAGFDDVAQEISWDFINTPSGATAIEQDDPLVQVGSDAAKWATVVVSLSMVVPANTAATAQLRLRCTGTVYSRGAVVWHRSRI